MKKIKVLFQLNEMAYGGTTKSILTFCRFLDREKFEVALFCYSDIGSFSYYRRYLESFLSIKKKKRFINLYQHNFIRRKDFENILGTDCVQIGLKNDFLRFVDKFSPDVIHFSRGIEVDFYTDMIGFVDKKIKCVETNVFGKSSNKAYLKRMSKLFFVSRWLRSQATWANSLPTDVLYNPILAPHSDKNLRTEFGIPDAAFVMGRISRPGLDDGANVLQILKKLDEKEAHLIIIGSNLASDLVLYPNVHVMAPTADEVRLSGFYNSLDVLMHYRKEGETFGMNIAEAMIHGKAVVSHKSFLDNAQVELLDANDFGECGTVVEENDWASYVAALRRYKQDRKALSAAGKNAKAKAMALYQAQKITLLLQKNYEEVVLN